MSEDAGFSFDEDSISGSLSLTPIELAGAVVDVIWSEADNVLSYAQANAPWSDRTGSARDGLGVDVYEENGTVNLALYHSVDYGIWLETIQSGRFATIMPTLEALAPSIFKSVNADFTGMSEESP